MQRKNLSDVYRFWILGYNKVTRFLKGLLRKDGNLLSLKQQALFSSDSNLRALKSKSGKKVQ